MENGAGAVLDTVFVVAAAAAAAAAAADGIVLRRKVAKTMSTAEVFVYQGIMLCRHLDATLLRRRSPQTLELQKFLTL